jgi:cation diffusion facilitator family transporter
MESVVHILATTFALYSVLLSARPADRSHPYGHGRIEFFSAGVEGVLIVLAAGSIIYVAAPRLLKPVALPDLDIGTGITAAAAVINLALGWRLVGVGRKRGSLTLVAAGKHVLTDSITSFGVVGGLLLVLVTSWTILDPIVAIAVASNIVITGSRLVRQSVGGLMDEADPVIIARVTEALNRNRKAEWIDVHRMRCWKSGEVHHVDFHLTLPYYLPVVQAHATEEEIRRLLHDSLDMPTQLLIHHDPCVPTCCSFCALESCQVRQERFCGRGDLTAEQVILEAGYMDLRLASVEAGR